MNTLRFIIADNNINNNGNNNMLHLIPVVTVLPLTISIIVKLFYSTIKNTITKIKPETICAALIALAIVYLFNMILEDVGNRLDNTFNKLKAEIKEKDEIIAKLLQQNHQQQEDKQQKPKQIQ